MSAALRVFAPAKLNLHLHVGPAGADGRHPLESLAVFADVGDWLRIAPGEGLRLDTEGPFAAGLSTEPDNLVLRAARLLASHAGIARGAHLVLEKNLPIASGIGGGSADAAAALRGLARLWDIEMQRHELERLAASLGADVPVCLASRTAYMTGTGEITNPVDGVHFDCVLVNPGVPLSTGAVYQAFDAMGLGDAFALEDTPRAPQDWLAWLKRRRNDLEPPANQLCPAIGEVLHLLSRSTDCSLARMSGSGATCLALCPDRAASLRLAALIRQERPKWWSAPARLGAVDHACLAGQP